MCVGGGHVLILNRGNNLFNPALSFIVSPLANGLIQNPARLAYSL